jgi:hypothetical protein
MSILRLSSFLCTFLVLLFCSSSLATPFSSANIDPSSLKILVNNEDVTKRIDIKQNASSVRIDYKLLTNLPAKANSEFTIQAKTRDGVSLESKVLADVVAKVQAPNVIPIIVPDDIPLTKATPYTVEGPRGLLVVARASDATDGFINTFIPIKALDEKGQLLSDYSSDTEISLRASVSNGSAKFVNGIALVPSKIKLDNAGQSTTIGHIFVSSSSSQGSSLRVQAVPNSKDDCNNAPVGTVPIALESPKTILDTIANAPYIAGLLDWMNGAKTLEFNVFGGKFTGGDLATIIWGVLPVVGDATVLADNAYRFLTGQGVNGFEAALAAVGLGLDLVGNEVLGAAVSGILAILKISRSGKGILANALETAFNACIAAGGGRASNFVRPLSIPDPKKGIKCAEEIVDDFASLLEDYLPQGTAGIRTFENRLEVWKNSGVFKKAIQGQNLSPEATDDLLYEWYLKYNFATENPLDEFLSPGGVFYSPGGVDKLFRRHFGNSPGTPFSSDLKQEDVLQLIDDAFSKLGLTSPDPIRRARIVDMSPKTVGRNGETSICIVIEGSLNYANRIVTAYPLASSGSCD